MPERMDLKPARDKTSPSPLRRSFDVYYRDKDRTRRMDALNAAFVRKGDLAFDIGAHVGDRTGSLTRLGASVVALEPQPHLFRALQLIYRHNSAVKLRCEAVGGRVGTLDLFVNSANPTVTTASSDLISAAQRSDQWHGQTWDRQIRVPVTTLDHLIDQYGVPDFVKIDVEGFEWNVLMGLTQALPSLSFEFTTIQRDVAQRCLLRLAELGAYEFNYSIGEEHALRHENWINGEAMSAELMALPAAANSGDIFARRL